MSVNEPHKFKTLVWVGSTLKDLRSFPADVKDAMGYALYQAQLGRKAPTAKPLRGFGSAATLEVVQDYYGDTYRVVYTVQYADVVYVLHAFQKKSKKGAATPKSDMDLIKKRLTAAAADHKKRHATKGSSV